VRRKGAVVFPPGETSQSVGIRLVDDHVRERTETFAVTLYEAEHARIGRADGLMTIRDDDKRGPHRHHR
jgi:hypothetical protein